MSLYICLDLFDLFLFHIIVFLFYFIAVNVISNYLILHVTFDTWRKHADELHCGKCSTQTFGSLNLTWRL